MLPLAGNELQQGMRMPNNDSVIHNSEMTTQDYRRRNLDRALEERGMSRAEFARLADKPRPNITQMLNGSRTFGAELAREFEQILNLRYGWLDEEVPLTNKAIHLARDFQSLNDDHQTEVVQLVTVLKAVEEHLAEAVAIRQFDKLAG